MTDTCMRSSPSAVTLPFFNTNQIKYYNSDSRQLTWVRHRQRKLQRGRADQDSSTLAWQSTGQSASSNSKRPPVTYCQICVENKLAFFKKKERSKSTGQPVGLEKEGNSFTVGKCGLGKFCLNHKPSCESWSRVYRLCPVPAVHFSKSCSVLCHLVFQSWFC